jgi:type I restriction enzyme S subunit
MRIAKPKVGYKQTEVGVIPADWEVKAVAQVSKPVRGGSPRPAGDPRFFNGSYIPWLTVAALTNIPASQLIVSDTATHLTEEGSFRSRILNPGTLIIANSGATLGVAKILGIRSCANDGIAALLNLDKQISPRYLAQYINTKTSYLREFVASGNGQPNLNTALIGNFKFPLPPTLAEQEAIASALSDADDLIESLETLIAKKRQIKHGTMQELLTGKRRLPGFTGKWETKRLGEIAQTRSERVDPRREGLFEFCVELEHIEQGTGRLLGCTATTSTSSLKSVFKTGDVLFGKLRAYLRKYWIAKREGVCSTEIWVLTPRAQEVTSEYLFQIVTVDRFIEVASTAYGTHMPRSDWNVVKNYEIQLPPLAEQTAIATVLSNIDAEISILVQKLSKARQVKQGMMQELLTGRTRLI